MSLAVARKQEPGGRFVWSLARRGAGDQLGGATELDPLLAQLLRNRGLQSAAEARAFLEAEEQPLGEPARLADLPPALERIERALRAGERIAVYGDYDADGLAGLALLTRALTWCGAEVVPFVPHRLADGYGLSDGPLRRLREQGVSLVVTVDCGVTAGPQIALATSLGLDVVVTDHHLPPSELPPVSVLNPRRADCRYPDKTLAGCGVAHRLAEAVLRARLPAEEAAARAERLLALAAIGTLGDVVPMLGENRTIVRRGLRQLQHEPGPGLNALAELIGLSAAQLDAEAVAFQIVPRLNAAGRLDSAQAALELLLTKSDQQARRLARRLDQLNLARRALTDQALEQARASLALRGAQPIALAAGDFPLGVVGLVASRLAEELNRPAIVLARDGERYVGSARSVGGFDILAALDAGREFLERYGGHPQAAGLALSADRLTEFDRALQRQNAGLLPVASQPAVLEVDAEARPATLSSWRLLDLLARLEPFGPANPPPLLLTRGLSVIGWQPFGDGHLRLRLQAESFVFEAVAFRAAQGAPPAGSRIDLVHRPRRRAWRGTLSLSLEVADWRPAA